MEQKRKTGKSTRIESIVQETLISNYEKYYRLAYSYVHKEADAQDIVQEGAYKAILHSDSLKKEEYADTWIYRIMMNEALTFLRKNKVQNVNIEDIQETAADTGHDLDLKQAVDALEPLERAVIILRFFEDLKLEQIAAITGENINTVKTKLYRTLKKLNIILDQGKAWEKA